MNARIAREIKLLATEPPPGVCAWPVNDRCDEISAQVQGPQGTVYEKGVFTLSVHIPPRYPFEPPQVRFITPVYHPNIDSGGRICLDILNMPPKGAWRPALNISTVLASIGLLLADPNPEDGLMTDVAAEYKHNRAAFDVKAKHMTQKHALEAKEGTAAERGVESGTESTLASTSASGAMAEHATPCPGPDYQASASANTDNASAPCTSKSAAQQECTADAKENSDSLNQRITEAGLVPVDKTDAAVPRSRLSLKKRMRVS